VGHSARQAVGGRSGGGESMSGRVPCPRRGLPARGRHRGPRPTGRPRNRPDTDLARRIRRRGHGSTMRAGFAGPDALGSRVGPRFELAIDRQGACSATCTWPTTRRIG